VQDKQDELHDDTKLTFTECYLHFVHHFMFVMTQSIILLEIETVVSSEFHEIMCSLKEKLEKRLRDQFFGSKVNSSLNVPFPY
jgi:hypothetical protein